VCVEHSTTARAQDVPGQFEQPQPRGVQEAADGFFLVEPMLGGEVQDVDAAQFPVAAVANRRFDGGNDIWISRIAQRIEQRLGVAHDAKLCQKWRSDSGGGNIKAQISVRMKPALSKRPWKIVPLIPRCLLGAKKSIGVLDPWTSSLSYSQSLLRWWV
jgi:hypothetical protein